MSFPFESGALAEIAAGPAAALTAVAIVAGRRACASGWGAQAAVAIAQGWPGERRLVLADLDVTNPSLHEQVGLELSEGIVDVVDYGISLEKVLRRVPRAAGTARSIEFLPGGYYVGEPEDLLGSEAWRRVLDEIAAMRGTLLAFVPEDLPGMEHIVARAGAVLIVAEGDEGATIAQRLQHPYAVLAIVTSAGTAEDGALAEPVVTAAAAEPVTEITRLSDEEFERIRLPTDRGARETLIREMRDRQRAARMTPGVDAGSVDHAAVASTAAAASAAFTPAPMVQSGGETGVLMRTESAAEDISLEVLHPDLLMMPARPSYRRPIVWTIIVVLAMSLLGGAWKFFSAQMQRTRAFTTAPLPAPRQPRPQPVVEEPRDTLPYTVALEAHRDMATAFQRVSALQVAEPGMRFHIAPLEREDRMFYHVMAGPVKDSATALALRDTLIAHGHKTTPTPTDVRVTPLAFAVGAFPTVAAAEQQLAELRTLGIPAYLIERGAQPRFQVYVGGFAAPAEAHVVRQLLRAAGIKDSLVMRTGSITP